MLKPTNEQNSLPKPKSQKLLYPTVSIAVMLKAYLCKHMQARGMEVG